MNLPGEEDSTREKHWNLRLQFPFECYIIYTSSGKRWGKVPQNGSVPRKGAAMLIGEYQHNIDAKGRVIVPAKFREDLGDCFYVTKGLDGCLFVLSAEEWNALQKKITAMPISKARSLQRFFFAGAAEVEPDKQGRILLPQQLREYAGLEKDVTFIGTSSRAEIWSSEKWADFNSSLTQDSIAEAMDMLDF